MTRCETLGREASTVGISRFLRILGDRGRLAPTATVNLPRPIPLICYHPNQSSLRCVSRTASHCHGYGIPISLDSFASHFAVFDPKQQEGSMRPLPHPKVQYEAAGAAGGGAAVRAPPDRRRGPPRRPRPRPGPAHRRVGLRQRQRGSRRAQGRRALHRATRLQPPGRAPLRLSAVRKSRRSRKWPRLMAILKKSPQERPQATDPTMRIQKSM